MDLGDGRPVMWTQLQGMHALYPRILPGGSGGRRDNPSSVKYRMTFQCVTHVGLSNLSPSSPHTPPYPATERAIQGWPAPTPMPIHTRVRPVPSYRRCVVSGAEWQPSHVIRSGVLTMTTPSTAFWS